LIVPHYAEYSAPLEEVLKKETEWNQDIVEEAVIKMKEQFTSKCREKKSALQNF
jgi:hypothetical protein